MKQYIAKRIFISIFVLFGVSILLYSIARMMPGDYVANITEGNMNITPEMLERMENAYGLDKGVAEGYISWLKDALRGDLGTSFIYQQPVTKVIGKNIGPTFTLAFTALVIQILLAVPLGILAARKQYSKTDYIIVAIGIIGISLPSFFFAAVLKRIFAMELRILPLSGMITAREDYTGFAHFADMAKHFVLPAAVFVITGMGSILRYVRTNMLEVLSADYVRTARAKGLPEYKVIGRHAFRNTLVPVVTMVGSMIPALFSGAVITEGLFAIEGLGKIALDAVYKGDIPYLMGFNLFIAAMTLLGTLVSDILYAAADPRVRLR